MNGQVRGTHRGHSQATCVKRNTAAASLYLSFYITRWQKVVVASRALALLFHLHLQPSRFPTFPKDFKGKSNIIYEQEVPHIPAWAPSPTLSLVGGFGFGWKQPTVHSVPSLGTLTAVLSSWNTSLPSIWTLQESNTGAKWYPDKINSGLCCLLGMRRGQHPTCL